jgi:triosephosphate isomerase (TIM)
MRRKIIAGNWKMNGMTASLSEADLLAASFPEPTCDIVICPPATLLAQLNWRLNHAKSPISIGGQDCHPSPGGAHTGDISAGMLRDAGASHVILGHSERRTNHGESDALVRAKTEAAHRAGLVAIVCIGETRAQRESGHVLSVVGAQMATSMPDSSTAANTIVAYEPVWAIGTGLVPANSDIVEMHDFLRLSLKTRFGTETAEGTRLLYGGSVKPSNAAELIALSNVDGFLVGGASLKAVEYSAIIAAAA